MLIWNKAPCVAIGVLAAFVLLLGTVVSEDISINTTVDNLDLATDDLTIIDEINELQLMQLPFADKLRNICELQKDRTPINTIGGGHRVHFEIEFLRNVLAFVNLNKRTALKALQNQTINNCATLHISNLPHSPTLDELKGMDIKGAFNKIYSSLLVHSGYSYFIYHQFTTSDRCSEDISGEQRLAELSRDLADKQRMLACAIQTGMKILGYYDEESSSVLNERITNLSQCSLRALRDCQVMKSINNLLEIMSEYVSDFLSESTTSLPNNQRTMP